MIKNLKPSSRKKQNYNRVWDPPCHVKHKRTPTKDIAEFYVNQLGEPCAESQLEETSCTKEEESSNTFYAHKIDAYESPRFRINESGKQEHEEHIEDREYNSVSLYKLAHLLIPIPEAMKILEAKVAVDKE